MNKSDFYKLLDSWVETPEYQEYEALCFECDTLVKQITNGQKIIEAFSKAMNNDIGKQLANEPMFLDFIRSSQYGCC